VDETVTLRQATMADMEVLLDHRVAMFRDMGFTDEHVLAEVRATSRAYFEAALPSGGYVAWLAEAGGEVVSGAGILVASWPGGPWDGQSRRAWILNVYTAPAWRRRGLAKRMMATVLAWCRAERFRIVSLHASKEGRVLYTAMGFKPTNEMRLSL
jgi:GNAT superfamily N-acetyltransferase